MKTAIKRIGSFVLALAMILSLSLTTVITQAATLATVKFDDVYEGDTITVYTLLTYDEATHTFTDMDDNFYKYVVYYAANVDSSAVTISSESEAIEYVEGLTTAQMTSLANAYETAVNEGSTYSLPSNSYTTSTGQTDGTAIVDFEDYGYYLVVGTTTAANSRVYSPTTVLVAEGSNNTVKVNGTEVTGTVTINMKSEASPTVDKTVKDSDNSWSSNIVTDDYVLDFVIAVNVPYYSDANSVVLKVSDTLTNLRYVNYSMTLYSTQDDQTGDLSGALASSTSGSGTEKGQLEASNYIDDVTINSYDDSTDTQTFSVELNYNQITSGLSSGSATVYLYYQATVTDGAVSVDYTNNTVTLDYSVNGNTYEEKESKTNEYS
ncbi:MAG: hypothetical protein LUD77_09325 [Clostridiales bacterium]|nr:hypothetical protein [Clostridiales bacterium]